jgi:hypothetical protein
MANPTTAAEWKQVAANTLEQVKQIESGIDKLYADRKALDPQIAALVAKRDLPSSDAFDRALFQNQIRALLDQQINIDNTISEKVRQVTQLSTTYNNALKQAALADSGPPDTLTNTPPVSITPDEYNTTVTTAENPAIESISPAPTNGYNPNDEFTGVDEQVAKQKQIADMGDFAGVDEAIAKQQQENTEYTTDSLGNSYKDGVLFRAAEVIENPEPLPATGYGDDPGQEYTTDSLGNQYKNGVLYRAADVAEDPNFGGTNVVGSTNSALNSGASTKVTPYTQDDWRVRLSLADSANYLYKIASKTDILYPLIATDGVVFPYTPTINSSYRANYDPSELTHSNYKMFFYKNSSVDDISINADFTAQDTAEANYMLAVIHFFKSATKMFYGQDTAPRAGTPPPLLYLTGYGLHQFQNHPLLLTNFSYNLPNDVDYIRAGSNSQWGGVSIAQLTSGSSTRLMSSGLTAGGVAKSAAFSGIASNDKVTYVPTKLSLSLTFSPVVTRNDISKNFSLKDYAAGKFSGRAGGGIW